MVTYKGYTADIKVDEESKLLNGKVLDVRDTITFHGKTVEEAIQEFEKSVDSYLEFCDATGQTPDKPFSGKLPFRTTPEIHKAIYLTSSRVNKSINSWMEEALVKALNRRPVSNKLVKNLIEKEVNLQAFLSRISKFLVDDDPLARESFIDALERLLVGLEEVSPFLEGDLANGHVLDLVKEIQ
ncbi:MAG: type II toxin-antitoxin system HicB family antitoxin, partial [Cyanobacteria bacterium P01_F01_bin.53]